MTPHDSFVPLTATSVPPAAREFHVAVLNHPAQPASDNTAAKGAGFQSLEAQWPVAFNGSHGVEKKIGEPRVTIQRDGERVTHLRIQCTCGQIMDLACVYDAPPPAPQPAIPKV